MSKKKKTIIVISVVTAIVLVLIISLCIAFAPRKIENILLLENIEKITVNYYTFEGEESIENFKELNAEEKDYTINILKNTKYKPIYDEIRYESRIIQIHYANGDIAQVQRYRMSITDKDGKTKMYKTIDLDFDYNSFLKEIFPKE